ncbi:alpha-1,2-fucosyltransferase [Vibrio mediterranei]
MGFISIDLDGGLGNQLFQYAFAKALSYELDINVSLSDSRLDKDQLRNLEVDKLVDFSIDDRLSLVSEPISFRDEIYYRLSKKLNKSIFGRYIESDLVYKPYVLSPNFAYKYRGYWQAPKYFQSYRDEILQTISFNNINKDTLLNLIAVDSSSKSVSVHVRRGDFVSNKAAAQVHGGVCNIDYYKRAVELVHEKYRDVKFFIFSDDRPWCEREFSWLLNSVVVSDTKNHFEDMYLMSKCDANIIANSTFSWWAAYINRSNDFVIAPKKWFANNREINIYPDGWLLV